MIQFRFVSRLLCCLPFVQLLSPATSSNPSDVPGNHHLNLSGHVCLPPQASVGERLGMGQVLRSIPQIGAVGLYRGIIPASVGAASAHGIRTGAQELILKLLEAVAGGAWELQVPRPQPPPFCLSPVLSPLPTPLSPLNPPPYPHLLILRCPSVHHLPCIIHTPCSVAKPTSLRTEHVVAGNWGGVWHRDVAWDGVPHPLRGPEAAPAGCCLSYPPLTPFAAYGCCFIPIPNADTAPIFQ